MGCKGPTTYNACSTVRWNEGTSFPIQSGHGCIGCSEDGFWDQGSFYDRLTNIKQFGIEANADTIGMTTAGVVGGAVVAHATVSALKRTEENARQGRGLSHGDHNAERLQHDTAEASALWSIRSPGSKGICGAR